MKLIKNNIMHDYKFIFTILSVIWFLYSCTDDLKNDDCFLKQPNDNVSLLTRSFKDTNQATCGTIEDSDSVHDLLMGRISYGVLDYAYSYDVKVFTHVIRKSDGTGADLPYTEARLLYNLNTYFQQTNLKFVSAGSEYIDSDKLHNISYDNKNELFNTNSHSDAIDVYIISDSPNFVDKDGASITGVANGIISTSCIVSDYEYAYAYGINVLPHEIGHCFGLYHTHHGTFAKESGVPELVDGSNSSFAGDYIVDTPADPNIWENGFYVGTVTDANGDQYRPSNTNLMSYASNYVTQITQNQLERMHYTIRNNWKLQAVMNRKDLSIAGPEILTQSTAYKIVIPSGYNVSWNVQTSDYTSQTQSTGSNRSVQGSSVTISVPASNVKSQRNVLTAKITTPKGYVFQTQKQVLYCKYSPATATLRWSSEKGPVKYNGVINLNNPSGSSKIKLIEGGNLYFYYSDPCGISSTEFSQISFNISDFPSLKKMSGAEHAFYFEGGASSKSEILLMINVFGSEGRMSLPYEIINSRSLESNLNTEIQLTEI
ncbi:MAG: hypothetical protein K2I16_12230 [Muribaculaceae bacterium]|nr:hypothetical protein [Muribaculaceae bacterium]